ncbi:SusC/RagA family TonB-linked outer membrane protein [Reichenbachiella ulvae]|uniref:TonB-dependent receptor n=1 Tax=Reichenbachiella ulvae TaxID=2980104 RepID=A0ABT3D0E5_9BACT|nr:TonB-dependent receptor [Reichenbachiella ulvae]MCV9389289.1 TonB-dependent receptor [Reichenbachiella ulvae]
MKQLFTIACLSVMLVASLGLRAQNQISGTVVSDVDGTGLPGANVIVKNTSEGTVTDLDGNFSISAPDDATLVVSFIGFETQEILVAGRSTITINLIEDSETLEEVVVIGYGEVKRSDMTGAVGSLKSETIEKVTPTSIQQALQGRVAGVQVSSNDGAPGSGISIKIRGSNTLTAGSQPLYVIDGYPIEQVSGSDGGDPFNPLSTINPNDIASLEVLKDASATAIYGSRGSNGVILITTKKGKAGKVKVDVSYNTSVSSIPAERIPEMMDAEEYTQLQYLRAIQSGQGQDSIWLARLEREWWTADTVQYTNWLDEITRDAIGHQANLSVSGGTEDTKYGVSIGYNDEDGILENSNFKRFSARLNLDQKVNNWLSLGLNSSYSNSDYTGIINDWRDGNLINQALFTNPFIPKDFENVTDISDDALGAFFDQSNPINEVMDPEVTKNFKRIFGKAYMNIDIAKGLRYHMSYGANYQLWNQDYFFPTSTRVGRNNNGYVELKDDVLQDWVWENRLSYNKKFGEHSVNATAVMEMTRRSRESLFLTATNLQEADEALGLYGLKNGTLSRPTQERPVDDALHSYLGRLVYTFKGKYILTGTFRADGSSKFADGYKWGYFPSVAAAWNAGDEEFIQNLGVFSDLRVRASYGVSGNQQIIPFQNIAVVGDGNPYNFGNNVVNSKQYDNFATEDLTWETTSSYDFGLEFGFFQNRLTATADYYYKKTEDLLLDQPLPGGSLFNSRVANVGELENKGFELTLNGVIAEKEDFSWDAGIVFSRNQSKVLDLGGQDRILFSSGNGNNNINRSATKDVMLRVGDPVGIYYGYVQGDVKNTAAEEANNPVITGVTAGVGAFNLADLDGNGVVDANDQIPLAYTAPDFTASFTNTFRYRNWELYTFFNSSYGNEVVNANIVFATTGQYGNNSLSELSGHYLSDVNYDGNYQAVGINDVRQYVRSEFIEDGSFVRLENVTLSYSFDSKFLDKAGLRNLKVYVAGNNLFVWTKYSWFDPEVNSTWGTASKVGFGKDQGAYPRARVFRVGINFGF